MEQTKAEMTQKEQLGDTWMFIEECLREIEKAYYEVTKEILVCVSPAPVC